MDEEASRLSAIKKLNAGLTEELSLDDAAEIFAFLDVNDDGVLEFTEVARLFKTVLNPPCTDAQIGALFQLTDKNQNGFVSAEEFRRAVSSLFFNDHIRRLSKERARDNQMSAALGHGQMNVTRSWLMDRLKWRVHRDDSFCTLPLSLVVMCVFIAVVVVHLDVWKRQQLQRGMEAWITGYGQNYPGPYQGEHVGDQVQMWEWLVSSGLTSIFVYCKNTSGAPLCQVGSRNILVGDVRLRQLRQSGETRSEWLLHSAVAVEHLRGHAGDYHGAATAAARHLWQAGFVDDESNSADLVLTTWNPRAQMFAVTEARVSFDDYGFAIPQCVSRAVTVDPYPVKSIIALDVLYFMLILYPLYGEVKEICSGIRIQGLWRGLIEYGRFWNCVDWMSIIMGITNILLWVMFCLATQADAIQDLLSAGDRLTLVPQVMGLDAATLEAAESDLRRIVDIFFALQLVMGFNVVSIMLKFFKAFQANPRLQLVTNTLMHAADELSHFLIVFLAIFTGFATSGHILFGDDIVEFSSFSRSMNTAYTALLGDFGWYSEQAVSDRNLGSGMPQWMLALWFWLFSSFVTLVILNMLLAIVMDHYLALVMHVRNAHDAPTIWKQTANYVNRIRETKGFIPFDRMLGQMKDKHKPAHVADVVTLDSLMASFGSMNKEQASFMMNWLEKSASEKARAEGDDENIARLKHLGSMLQSVSEQVHFISLNSTLVNERLQEANAGIGEKLGRVEASVASCKSRLGDLERLAGIGISHWKRTPTSRETKLLLALLPNLELERPVDPAPLLPGNGQALQESKLLAEHPAKRPEVRQPWCTPIPPSSRSSIATSGNKGPVTLDRRR